MRMKMMTQATTLQELREEMLRVVRGTEIAPRVEPQAIVYTEMESNSEEVYSPFETVNS